jgi:hypothetical protein
VAEVKEVEEVTKNEVARVAGVKQEKSRKL